MPPAAMPLVSVRGLRKRFNGREILHGLDFDIPPGRIYGLIGHNGAGKTTTLNAMLGLTSAEGSVRVLGLDPYRHRARLMNDVTFISDVASLPRFFRVNELLDMMREVHPGFSRTRAVELLEGTEVKQRAKVGQLSKGMLAQLHLAVVMAIDAKLLVLDEPTLGLDITYRKRFYRRLVEEYLTPNRTVLITTHQVDEIASLLTDVMFIRDGALLLHSPMAAVDQRFLQLVAPPDTAAAARSHRPVFEETRFGQTVMIFDAADRDTLAALGTVSAPTLSDLFVALMTREGETV